MGEGREGMSVRMHAAMRAGGTESWYSQHSPEKRARFNPIVVVVMFSSTTV